MKELILKIGLIITYDMCCILKSPWFEIYFYPLKSVEEDFLVTAK